MPHFLTDFSPDQMLFREQSLKRQKLHWIQRSTDWVGCGLWVVGNASWVGLLQVSYQVRWKQGSTVLVLALATWDFRWKVRSIS